MRHRRHGLRLLRDIIAGFDEVRASSVSVAETGQEAQRNRATSMLLFVNAKKQPTVDQLLRCECIHWHIHIVLKTIYLILSDLEATFKVTECDRNSN